MMMLLQPQGYLKIIYDFLSIFITPITVKPGKMVDQRALTQLLDYLTNNFVFLQSHNSCDKQTY